MIRIMIITKANKKLLMIGGALVVGYLIYRKMKKPAVVPFKAAPSTLKGETTSSASGRGSQRCCCGNNTTVTASSSVSCDDFCGETGTCLDNSRNKFMGAAGTPCGANGSISTFLEGSVACNRLWDCQEMIPAGTSSVTQIGTGYEVTCNNSTITVDESGKTSSRFVRRSR